jgi:hypothetical protein
MRFAVKSLILTWAIVSLVSFCGLIYVFPGYSLDSAFSEAFRKHPGPEGSFWFDWRLIFLVVGIFMTFWLYRTYRRQYGKLWKSDWPTNANMRHKY